MKKAWKTILIIALCILIVGEIVLKAHDEVELT